MACSFIRCDDCGYEATNILDETKCPSCGSTNVWKSGYDE